MIEQTPAIIVMCKAPVPGLVKTRLIPFLSPEQAASLAVSFAQDALTKFYYSDPYIAQFVAFAPRDGGDAALKQILPPNLRWIEQEGKDLGDRMQNALVSVFKKQIYSPLVVIGTDSPTLPPKFIKKAFNLLSNNKADIVLGKAADGGYYLIGVNAPPDSRIFADVEWSSPRTFEQTMKNVKELNLRLQILPEWYDVDTPQDLRRLYEDTVNNIDAAKHAPQTAEWIRQNENLFLRVA